MTLPSPTRRRLILNGIIAAASAVLPAQARAQNLPATPECRDGDEPTVKQTEGPFYKPRSPERTNLRDGVKGKPIELTGFVLTRACKPVDHALVDLWHADADGNYDQRGFRCRGHVFTDAGGRFRFLTVVPAVYTGRTRHFHVKVQAPGRALLTTQLYFPNEPQNTRDGLFRSELLMKVADSGGAVAGRFDFVVG